MKILVINSGSSSIKYQLFDMESRQPLTAGLVERIGEAGSRIKQKRFEHKRFEQKRFEAETDGPTEVVREREISDHRQGLEAVAELLLDDAVGVIQQAADIAAVGHRVVHGGEVFNQTMKIDAAVKDKVEELIPLAPLHNPPNLQGIEVAEAVFPEATQVAVFDTAFHQTMPPAAYRYPLPQTLYEEHGVRAYGFHGTSHLYVSKATAAYLGQPLNKSNLVTAHLGNGCSITAVRKGQSVDTSMGMTPLAGLMMGTRSGDIDPGVITFLGTKLGLSFAEVDKLLNKEAGLRGICGASDVRDIEARRAEGDEAAQLALDMYCYRIKKFIGAYMAALERVDAVVFTAGVGENSSFVRAQVCQGLENLGVVLDAAKNEAPGGGAREIQAAESRVKILVIPTNEELEIATQTYELIQQTTG